MSERPTSRKGWKGYRNPTSDEEAELEARQRANSVNNSFESILPRRRRANTSVASTFVPQTATPHTFATPALVAPVAVPQVIIPPPRAPPAAVTPQVDTSGDIQMADAPEGEYYSHLPVMGDILNITVNKRLTFANTAQNTIQDATPRPKLQPPSKGKGKETQDQVPEQDEDVDELLAAFHKAARADPIKPEVISAKLSLDIHNMLQKRREHGRSENTGVTKAEDCPPVETGLWRDDNGHFLAVYIPDGYLDLGLHSMENFREKVQEVELEGGFHFVEIVQDKVTDDMVDPDP